jgi:signal transduction histidine kinase/ActR/RegA family two-component response regulator
MIRAVKRTIAETKRIQDDVSYQIPVKASDFSEFDTIYNALNAMADTINKQVVKLEESRRLLERRVSERTTELSQVNQQLRAEIQDRIENEKKRIELETRLNRAEKMEAIGTLAGGVAHDLNNILSGIISYPELILMDLPEDHPMRDPVMTIKSSGEKAAAIVEDLLTLARRGVANHQPVDLNLLINQFISSPECEKILFYHPQVNIETRLAPDINLITGSSVHLSKTIMNLVSNAAEAIPHGGTIFISTEASYIDFTIRGYNDVKEGEYLKMTIRDTGEGIAAEDLGRIFEPFFSKKQLGRSGTGLGMAVVWGTVKDHAGYIDVDSQLGKGTAFTLYFPLDRNLQPVQSEAAIHPEKYMGHGETVLVIDDVNEQRDIARRMLERLGYQVACATSGEDAVAYVRSHSADILLLDMIMPPGINGLETYRRIKALVPGQKAVISSGFSETELVCEAQQIGAGPYIKKPYSFEQIGIAIRETLGKGIMDANCASGKSGLNE